MSKYHQGSFSTLEYFHDTHLANAKRSYLFALDFSSTSSVSLLHITLRQHNTCLLSTTRRRNSFPHCRRTRSISPSQGSAQLSRKPRRELGFSILQREQTHSFLQLTTAKSLASTSSQHRTISYPIKKLHHFPTPAYIIIPSTPHLYCFTHPNSLHAHSATPSHDVSIAGPSTSRS